MAKLKLTISRYSTKEITTTRGKSMTCNFNADGKWYNAFVGSWNKNWANGMTVEIDDSQIKTTQKGDKTYLNINAPPKAATGAPGANPDDIKRILKGIEMIYKDLQEIKAALFIAPKEAQK